MTVDPATALKLARPRVVRPVLHRRRVVDALSAAPAARLVLVSAPPGFGKTTAVLDWLSTTGTPAVWLTLDASDDDPRRFGRGLVAAAACLGGDGAPPGAGGVAAGRVPLAEGGSDGPAELASSVVLALPEGAAGVLVLDDYHHVKDRVAHRTTAALVDLLPSSVRVAILTRADPPLPLARLRARGDLVEVRGDTLRLTETEAAVLLERRLGPVLEPDDAALLVARTEGWPAVVELAAAALAGADDVHARVRGFAATHRFVLDYVVEEVLGHVPDDTAQFLLRTSVLDRLTGELCDVVTGMEAGTERLEALERANLLVVPLDDERRWYRYHALFADILRARLRLAHPDEVPELHARASTWHAERGDDDAAVHHALLAGDEARTMRLVGEASLLRLNAGELGTVRRWLGALPAEVIRREAQLSASAAWCRVLVGEVGGVAAMIDDAERALAAGRDGGPVSGPILPAQLALLRSRLADLEGDAGTAVLEARRAASLVPGGIHPVAGATMRGDALVLLARALLSGGDVAGAEDAYLRSLPELRAGGNAFAAGRAVADLVLIALDRGDGATALRLCEEALALDVAGETRATGTVHAALGRTLEARGDATGALAAARRAVELGAREGDPLAVRAGERIIARLESGGEHAALPGAREAPRQDVPDRLTGRELEVLRLAALGRSNRQIADALFLTVGTVKSHLHAVSRKLGASNRVEAIELARRAGLL